MEVRDSGFYPPRVALPQVPAAADNHADTRQKSCALPVTTSQGLVAQAALWSRLTVVGGAAVAALPQALLIPAFTHLACVWSSHGS